MRPSSANTAHVRNLAGRLAASFLQDLFLDMIDRLASLHPDIEVRSSEIEVRIAFSGNLICRMVPYRELLHVQIGESPMWEVRVRGEKAYYEALDKCILRYLSVFSATAAYPE